MNPIVIISIFIGAMAVLVFCSMTLKAVRNGTNSLFEEISRQFKEITGILKGEEKADYDSCVITTTQNAQKTRLHRYSGLLLR